MPFVNPEQAKIWARNKRARYKAAGLCERCAQPRADDSATMCAWHRDWTRERRRIWSWNLSRRRGIPTRYKDGRTFKPHILTITELFPIKQERLRQWALARQQRKVNRSIDPITSYYPFLSRPSNQDDELMLQADAVVSRALPQQIRADVCQELLLGVLSGEVRREEMAHAAREYIKRIYRNYERPRQFVSIDDPLSSHTKRTYADILMA